MKSFRMLMEISAFLMLTVPLWAGDSAADIIEEIQEKYERFKNFSAEFVQTEHFSMTGSKNEVTGKIYVKDGVKYRLESEDQIIVTDGKDMWTYSAFNKQVILDNFKEGDGSLLPRDMLFRYPNEFLATLLDEVEIDGEDFYLLKLDPRENVHGFIKTMKIWVNQDTYLIKRIEYTDFNDSVTDLTIRKIDTQSSLSDDLFTFQAKEGVEVVDLRL